VSSFIRNRSKSQQKKRSVVFIQQAALILFILSYLVQIFRLPAGFIQQATTNQTN